MSNDNEKETVGQAETRVSIPGPGPLNPLPPSIDWSRPVQTKGSGYPVRIIAIDLALVKPVLGVIEGRGLAHLGNSVSCWTYNGLFCPGTCVDNLDLENIPEVPHV